MEELEGDVHTDLYDRDVNFGLNIFTPVFISSFRHKESKTFAGQTEIW